MITDDRLLNHPEVYYLNDLGVAIKNVGSEYFNWKLKDSNGHVKDAYCERVFAYELYHQLRKIMECPVCKEKRYNGLTLNGEAIKSNNFFKNVFEGLYEVNEDKTHKFIPDLILHKDLGSFEHEEQIYMAEIKMKGNDEALGDLVKLTNLKKTKLNFEFYIFIYVNIDMSDFISEVEKLGNEEILTINDEIVCFCTNFGAFECASFGQIKSQITTKHSNKT